MELNYLKVFYEVAKLGRFTEAAKHLNISQSALSRAVGLLEEGAGVQLFLRSKKGVTLTPVGDEVFRQCEELFRTVNAIERICRGNKETVEGTIRFATTDHVINELLIKPLQSFRYRYPAVVPSVTTGSPDDIAQAVLNTDCEFGLSFVKVTLPQLDYDIVRRESMALVCAPELWRKHRTGNTTKTLKRILDDAGYIASIGASLQARPSRVLQELFGEMPRIGFEANGQEIQKRVCLEGGGVAYLARFLVNTEIRDGKLFEIPVENQHSFNLWLATRKGRELSLSAKMFLEHLRGEITL